MLCASFSAAPKLEDVCIEAKKNPPQPIRPEGDNSIVASLNAIEDSMGVLGVDYDDPSIESIVQPDEKTTREELFKKLMAE